MGEAFLVRRGGKPPVPGIFGNGSDGDLYIKAGETVVLPVTVPYQSVVEKQYRSIVIEAGGVLKCSDPNAGLVLHCKGDCTIYGAIDQSMKAPTINPLNNYLYPPELQCGSGGGGGGGGYRNGQYSTKGGQAMPARPYGGGYGGGGGGGSQGNGGNATDAVAAIVRPFIGGCSADAGGVHGKYGGGGSTYPNILGGDSPGAHGNFNSSNHQGSGGAGHLGGGVLLLYLGGNSIFGGSALCNGGNGGNGCGGGAYNAGGGGGGGGGGAIYLLYNLSLRNTGAFAVDAGKGGAGGTSANNYVGAPGAAGTIGTITIKKYEKGMTV